VSVRLKRELVGLAIVGVAFALFDATVWHGRSAVVFDLVVVGALAWIAVSQDRRRRRQDPRHPTDTA
jgi:hypothetical protein